MSLSASFCLPQMLFVFFMFCIYFNLMVMCFCFYKDESSRISGMCKRNATHVNHRLVQTQYNK